MTFLTDPTLALGLSGLADWSTQLPFLDLMKMSRPMWVMYSGNEWGQDHDALLSSGVLDADGWPTALPPGATGIRASWGFGDGIPGTEGPFVLTWDGEGTIALGSAQVTSTGGNRIVFTNATDGTFWLDITSTDPEETGDYIRNIRIVPAKYEALADAGEIFNPDFLAVIQDARQVRFMDWQVTNGSPLEDWADRPKVGNVTWSSFLDGVYGAPVEIMVALCNKIGADPWFCMPHKTTDDYVEQFATYVRDNLKPGLIATVEYSNEMWNWGFGQTHWADAQAKAIWGTDEIDFIAPNALDYQAMRATQVAVIWDEVFGAEADARVVNALGLQNGSSFWLGSRMLNGLVWETKDPSNFIEPTSVLDAVAVTTYFGTSTLGNGTLRAELMSYLSTHSDEQGFDWLKAKLLDPAYSQSIPHIIGLWNGVKAVTDANGLDLIAYEGGQHVHQSYNTTGMTSEQVVDLNDFITAFVRSQQMADLYAELWEGWEEIGDGPFMHFTDVGRPSIYGSWGLIKNLADTNPRAELLFDLNRTAPSWFGDGGGDRYKPKATKQLEAGELAEFNVNGGLMIGSTGHNVARSDAPLSAFAVSRDDNGDLLLTSARGVMRLKDYSGCIAFAGAA